MSYQQTTTHSEAGFQPRPASTMYTQPQIRAPRDNQASAAGTPGVQADQMAAMMSQLGGLNLPATNLTSGTAAMGASPLGTVPMQYYMSQDGQYFVAPAGLYPQQAMAQAQPVANTTQLTAEGAYNPYAMAPYLAAAQAGYPGYMSGYPMMPYAAAARGYYTDRADHHKDVPGLENRRGSYSTNESAPSTPYYGAISQREGGNHIAVVDRSVFGTTPSPQQLAIQHADHQVVKALPYKAIPINVDLDALLVREPVIPHAVPAVFTPRENMRTLDQSLSNPIHGNRNVYIRGLHPQTNDMTLAAYAARFGSVETSKAIIDTSTGACKGFGFAKYHNVRDSELCIRGFYKLGYEVGFARESFNSRLKAEGDESSTNLYVSNLPKDMSETELGAIFMDYTVSSSRILRDSNNNSRGVGFARFETRDICEEIICKFHGQPVGEQGLLLQVRYADTPAQKDLKRITTERRQFRTNEYNVGAYGAPSEMSLTLTPPMPSPVLPRTTLIAGHITTTNAPRSSATSWMREASANGSMVDLPAFKDIDRQVKVELTEATPNKSKDKKSYEVTTPTISDDGSGDDSVHCDAPAVAHGGSVSPTARKS